MPEKNFQPYEIIKLKRNGHLLNRQQLYFLVTGFTKGKIPDYQMAAFLMAVYFKGMTPSEMFDYTELLLHSGKTIDLSKFKIPSVDKHSTGGVGDKASIPLAPLVASAGVPVPMISGRGLGHTGGTLDKLESIPGFNVNLNQSQFIRLLKKYNVAMMGQTKDIVPADKKIYALRDVTGTVESYPLIVGSILSKKLAEGAHGLVFDVKTGSGAFMKTRDEAETLAKLLVSMAKKFKRKAVALITDMNQPLGYTVGNSLEIRESIEMLQGKGPADLEALVLELGGWMLKFGGVVKDVSSGKKILAENIHNKKGLESFRQMVAAQQGNPKVVEDISLLPKSEHLSQVKAGKAGYINQLDALKIGQASVLLGAGRLTLDSSIDPAVGIVLKKKVGDAVKPGETIAEIHYNSTLNLPVVKEMIIDACVIKDKKVKSPALIIDVID
jgi:pyrimidine-nucleoside phosphorylase